MTLVKDAGSSLLTNFTVPFKGTWKGVAANMLGPDMLYDSINVYLRKGKLRQRPGYAPFNSNTFTNPIIGGGMAVTPVGKVLLAIEKGALYTAMASDTVWSTDITTPIANSNNSLVDITYLETMSQYAVIIASEGYQLKVWIQGSGVSSISGAPIAKSVCTAADRIVALVNGNTLQWTSTLSYSNWPALAVAKVAATNDVGIAVVPLGTLDFVLYKERSLYVAKAQAGSDAAAFNIQFRQTVEGPAGVHAVIDAGGTHFYMTANGRIGAFDGSSYVKWIADGLWFYLQDDINPTYAYKIFAVFDYRQYTISFHYPRTTDEGGLMTGMVIINIPLEGSNIDSTAAFLGISTEPLSFGYERRFNNVIDRSMLFTQTATPQAMTFDELVTTDNGMVYQCAMQTGLFPLPDMRHSRLSVESFLQRQNGYGGINIMPVVSDALETENGIVLVADSQIIDLNNDPVQEYVGFDRQTRFFGLRYTWSSDSTVRYGGAMVYGRAMA
jgi:hypothetical protein